LARAIVVAAAAIGARDRDVGFAAVVGQWRSGLHAISEAELAARITATGAAGARQHMLAGANPATAAAVLGIVDALRFAAVVGRRCWRLAAVGEPGGAARAAAAARTESAQHAGRRAGSTAGAAMIGIRQQVRFAAVRDVAVAISGRAGTIGNAATARRAARGAARDAARVAARAAVLRVAQDRGLATIIDGRRRRMIAIARRVTDRVAGSGLTADRRGARALAGASAGPAVQ